MPPSSSLLNEKISSVRLMDSRRGLGREPRTPGHPGHSRGSWPRTVLHICLLAWPARHRRTRGRQLVETALDLIGDHRAEGLLRVARELAAEALDLLVAGFGLRMDEIRRSIRAGVADLFRDTRLAVRVLGRRPGFTLVASLTLALGIGANGVVFSWARGVLLDRPPYDRPDELVVIWNRLPGADERIPVAGPDAAVLAERLTSLRSVAFSVRGVDGSIASSSGQPARHARIAEVTSNFFEVLGTPPALGRVFDEGDGPDGSPSLPPVVLSDLAWRTAFDADPEIVGREVRLNGLPALVIGVMPTEFELAVSPDAGVVTDVDAWLPLSVSLGSLHRSDDRIIDQDSDNTGVVIGRLAPDGDMGRVSEQLRRIETELGDEVPTYATAGLGFTAAPLLDDAVAHARPLLVALVAGVALVLIVACMNIAGLLSVRGIARAHELAVRTALGAERMRLVRQLTVEGLVLVGLGLIGALALAAGLTSLLGSVVPPTLAAEGGVELDGATLFVTAVVAGSVAVVAGVLPGVRTGAPPRRALEATPARSGYGPSPARTALVAAQIALSVVLLLSAGLFLRTVTALEATGPGFLPSNALTFRVSLRLAGQYGSPAERARLMRTVEDRLVDLPQVRSVGVVGVLPLGGGRWTQGYGLPGQPEFEWQRNRADFRVATSGYFDAIGTRIVEGRGFTRDEDLNEDERVVIVDRILAERVAAGASAVDRVIGVPVDGAPVQARIVGVVEHIRYDRLERDGRETIYVPYRQEASREVSIVLRTVGDPASVAPAVRQTMLAIDPRIPVYALSPLQEYVDGAVAPRRFALRLLAGFALLALSSVVVGLYGVVALDVGRRKGEIGLRMAVGASRLDVLRSVLSSGVPPTATGLLVGIGLGAGVAHAIDGLLFGVSGSDPMVWGSVIAVVLLATLAASAIPAFRASALSPTEALRAD